MVDQPPFIADLSNMAVRAGWLAQHLVSFQVRLAAARSQTDPATCNLWLDRIDRDVTEALQAVDAADAQARARIDLCRAAPPTREFRR